MCLFQELKCCVSLTEKQECRRLLRKEPTSPPRWGQAPRTYTDHGVCDEGSRGGVLEESPQGIRGGQRPNLKTQRERTHIPGSLG